MCTYIQAQKLLSLPLQERHPTLIWYHTSTIIWVPTDTVTATLAPTFSDLSISHLASLPTLFYKVVSMAYWIFPLASTASRISPNSRRALVTLCDLALLPSPASSHHTRFHIFNNYFMWKTFSFTKNPMKVRSMLNVVKCSLEPHPSLHIQEAI